MSDIVERLRDFDPELHPIMGLAAATGPDRELDFLILEHMGTITHREVEPWTKYYLNGKLFMSIPEGCMDSPAVGLPKEVWITDSIDAALALVAEKLPGWGVSLVIVTGEDAACTLFDGNGARYCWYAPTAPLAILRALVAAMEGQR